MWASSSRYKIHIHLLLQLIIKMNIESIIGKEVQERLLERLRSVASSGTFKFFTKNLYTCLKVSNQYGTIAAEMLEDLGFHLTATQLKPGDPTTHVSVLINMSS